jgi:hypothetical protein
LPVHQSRNAAAVLRSLHLALLILVPLLVCWSTAVAAGSAEPATAVDVTRFGARPDGKGDSGPAFARAAAELNLRVGGRILVPPGVYNFDTTFDIPKFTISAVVEFEMVGATLKTTKPIAIFRRLPADQNEAMQMLGAVFLLTGGRFAGTGLPGQIGLEFATTYSSIIRATQFELLDIGFDGYFNLGLRFENVRTTLNRTIDLRIQSGRDKWLGADKYNSASNHTTFEGVRIYSGPATLANIAVLGASGVSIRNSIIEGHDPVNGIYFDNEGAIVHTFIVENLHSESTPENAIITLKGTKPGGVHRISTVFFQTAHTLLDARELSASRISIEDIPYVAPLKSAFKLDPTSPMARSGSWRFVDWPASAKDARWWSGGIVPENLTQH